MKKLFLTTVLVLSSAMLLTSCLKNDPEHNKTIYYGYQQIPNINDFMPQRLLFAMGENNLHYGDEPPKLEGSYIADSIIKSEFILTPESHLIPSPGAVIGYRFFDIYEQHKGISKLHYIWGMMGITAQESLTDTTYAVMKTHLEQFVADTLSPIFFKTEDPSLLDVFKNVYIMGTDPYFTIYYYDITRNRHASNLNTDFEPLRAHIISGRIDKETIVETDTVNHRVDTVVKTVIKDFRWGVETMEYYNKTPMYYQLLESGNLNQKGDIVILTNPKTIHQGSYTINN